MEVFFVWSYRLILLAWLLWLPGWWVGRLIINFLMHRDRSEL